MTLLGMDDGNWLDYRGFSAERCSLTGQRRVETLRASPRAGIVVNQASTSLDPNLYAYLQDWLSLAGQLK